MSFPFFPRKRRQVQYLPLKKKDKYKIMRKSSWGQAVAPPATTVRCTIFLEGSRCCWARRLAENSFWRHLGVEFGRVRLAWLCHKA